MMILIEVTPLDAASGNRVTLRAASADDKAITALNGVRWWPALKATPTLDMTLFDGDFTSPVDTGTATFTVLTDKLARLDAAAPAYRWAGASVKIYAGNSGDAWPWTQWFAGRVDTFQAQANQLRITAKVDTDAFLKNALTLSYAGTGGIEGGADLKNKVKPWLFGRALNVEPVLIDATNSVFQFSAYGPIQAVNNLYERASDYGASLGDYATYTALVAATVPAGRWATCLASGLVRLGAPPYGVITGDVDGDKPSGTWIRTTGAILNRVLTNAGVSAGLIDSASLTALDTAVPYTVNLFLADQTTLLDLCQRLARPCNAQAGVSWLGKLFVTRPVISGSPALTLDAQGRQKPAVTQSAEVNISPPYWRIEMGAQRSWRVHSFDEIAFFAALVNRGAYSGATGYREGNIVTDQGTSWLYTSTTPGSGNAPPTLPTVANAFWTAMSDPGSAVIVTPSAAAFRTADNAFNPSSQTITFTAALYNLSGTVAWVARDASGTTVKSGTGTSFSLAQSDMGTNLSLIVTATCGWASSQPLTVPVIDDSTAAAGATADLTLQVVANAVITGGNFFRNTTSTDAGGIVRVAERLKGAVSIGAKISALGTYFGIDNRSDAAIAATSTAALLATGFRLDIGTDGTIRCRANGTIEDASTTCAVGDTVFMVNDETKVEYWKNGAAFFTSPTAPTRGQAWAATCAAGPLGTVGPILFRPATDNNWNSFGGTGLPETSADITRAVSWALNGGTVTLNADSSGAILTGQLPLTLPLPVVTVGGASKRTDNLTTYAISDSSFTAGYVTVDNTTGSSTKGQVTLTGSVPGAGGFNLVISYNGQQIASYHCDVAKVSQTGITTGGGGGGSSSPTSFGVSGAYTTTDVVAGTVTGIVVPAGQSLHGFFDDTFFCIGINKSVTAAARFQYSVTGSGSWSNMGSDVGSTATTDFESNAAPGSITVNQSVTPAANTYDVRLLLSRTGGTAASARFDSSTATVSVS